MHALARDASVAAAPVPGTDLVDLVEEHDAVVLDFVDGEPGDLFGVEELLALLREQRRVRLLDGGAPRLRPAAHGFAEDIADRDGTDGGAGHVGQFHHRHRGSGLGQLDLDLLVVELA